jgi:hypothetical protein
LGREGRAARVFCNLLNNKTDASRGTRL